MKVMTIFFGLSLGALIVECFAAPEPRVSPQGAETSNAIAPAMNYCESAA